MINKVTEEIIAQIIFISVKDWMIIKILIQKNNEFYLTSLLQKFNRLLTF